MHNIDAPVLKYICIAIHIHAGTEIRDQVTYSPTQLVFSQVFQTSLQLHWTYAHNGVNYFNIYCYHTSCPYCSHLSTVEIVTTTSTVVTVNKLTPLTEYECCVTAISSSGESLCSQEVKHSTLVGIVVLII